MRAAATPSTRRVDRQLDATAFEQAIALAQLHAERLGYVDLSSQLAGIHAVGYMRIRREGVK